MVKKLLIDSYVEAGKILLNKLDSKSFNITAAMWFFYTESEEWQLLLYSPDFGKNGKDSNTIYTSIFNVINELGEYANGLSLDMIKIITTNSPLIELLNSLIRVEGISNVRCSSNYINGVYIEDALIYRNLN